MQSNCVSTDTSMERGNRQHNICRQMYSKKMGNAARHASVRVAIVLQQHVTSAIIDSTYTQTYSDAHWIELTSLTERQNDRGDLNAGIIGPDGVAADY